MTLRGVEGRLTRGYAVAAIVGPYTVTRPSPNAALVEMPQVQLYCTLRATVQQVVDAFQLTQPGLRFVATVGPRRWSWAVERQAIAAGILTARLSARPDVE